MGVWEGVMPLMLSNLQNDWSKFSHVAEKLAAALFVPFLINIVGQ